VSAPRRTSLHPVFTDVFWGGVGTPPVSFEKKLWAYDGTRWASRKLFNLGIKRDRLVQALWALAHVKLGELCRTEGKRRLSRVSRATQIRLQRFPERIRKMARDIEDVNQKLQSGELQAGSAILAESFLSRDALAELWFLPKRLDLYATYLESLENITAKRKALPKQSDLHPPLLDLIAEAEKLSGERPFKDVARLLEAAYHAIGCNVKVNPKALAMQFSRELRK
jgi:hypothetical protein